MVLALLAITAWKLRAALPRQARALGLLAGWQLLSGLSNVVLDWPLGAALAHTGGAAALVVVLTWALCGSRLARTSERAGTAYPMAGRKEAGT